MPASRVVFAGPRTLGAWGAVLNAVAPVSARGTVLESCGSAAALQRHYRKGEDPCGWCAARARERRQR